MSTLALSGPHEFNELVQWLWGHSLEDMEGLLWLHLLIKWYGRGSEYGTVVCNWDWPANNYAQLESAFAIT